VEVEWAGVLRCAGLGLAARQRAWEMEMGVDGVGGGEGYTAVTLRELVECAAVGSAVVSIAIVSIAVVSIAVVSIAVVSNAVVSIAVVSAGAK